MVFDRPDETEVVKVLDFGYARSVGEARRQDAARGTEGYMAPELAAGSAATPGADLFSVGLILYELVTRRSAVAGRTHPPFQAASVAGHAAIDRNNPHVPPELVEVLQRATAHHPQHRMRTAEEFLEALDAVERASRPPLSPPRPQVREDAPAAPRSSQPNVPVAAAAPGSDFFGDSTRAVTAEELEAANAGVQPGSSPGRPLSPSPVQAPLPAYGLGSEPEMTRALTAEELEMAGASAFQGAPTIPGDGPASPVRGAPAPSPWPASLDEGGDATVALDLDINDPWGVGTDGDNDDDDDDGDDRPAEGTMELDLNDIKIIASHALAGPDRTREVSLDEVLTFTGAKRTTTESD
jgi:serine/threonine-protein kinase